MTEEVLPNNMLNDLRNKSIILENEVALRIGDIYFAENVISKTRRILDASLFKNKHETKINETNVKTLLKG
jgi:hypothetical protein